MAFIKAVQSGIKIRFAIIGPTGCGKTWTALRIATRIGGPIGVIDSEHGSSLRYANYFDFDVDAFGPNDEYGPLEYVRKIQEGEKNYNVLIIDSLSHAWIGKGGALQLVDRAAAQQKGNKYTAWRNVTPQHDALVTAMLACKCHLIVTLRAKMEYALDEEDGKKIPRKLGMGALQREGIEYEFDVAAEMDQSHTIWFPKTRCPDLDGKTFIKPGEEVAQILLTWAGEPGYTIQQNESEKPATIPPPAKQPQESSNEPLTIQYMLNRLPAGLAQLGVHPDELADAVEAASLLIKRKFNVNDLSEIPDTQVEDVRVFMNADMIERLTPDFVPEAA